MEQTIFLEWINKRKDSNDSSQRRNFLLNESLMKYLFNLILTDKIMIDYNTMNLNIYNCIRKMFEAVNMKEGSLEFSETIKVYKYDQLSGFKFFSMVLIKCQNEEVIYLKFNRFLTKNLCFINFLMIGSKSL